ncbi:MAG: hypothetical protein V3V10_00595 [Planctomycetota bacterium]
MAKNKKRRNKVNVRAVKVQSSSFELIEERAQELYLKRGGELLDFCIKSARACLELFHLELEDYKPLDRKLTVSAGVAMRATAQLARYRREKVALWDDCIEYAREEYAMPEPEVVEAATESENKVPDQVPPKAESTAPPESKISQPVPALTG